VQGGQVVETNANVTNFFGLLEYFVSLMGNELKINFGFGAAIHMLKRAQFENRLSELRESISKDLQLHGRIFLQFFL
jgi:hypothetical protein